jgi:ABC-type transport system involved in multi-copper enzyme maturation permease subunit
MLTVIRQTIAESIHRRMAMVLLTAATLTFLILVYVSRFTPGPEGTVSISVLGQEARNAVPFVLDRYQLLVALSGGLMFFLAMFAIAPLLTTYTEKGAAELVFAKGVARWQVFLGRVIGAYAVFLAAMVLMNALPALYYWGRAGIVPRYFLSAIGVLCVSFLGMLCLMALASTFQSGVASVVTIGFLDLALSSALLSRAAWYQELPYDFLRRGLDAAYQVLPKHEELLRMAQGLLDTGHVRAWRPLWTTLAFCAVSLVWAGRRMSRRSF